MVSLPVLRNVMKPSSGADKRCARPALGFASIRREAFAQEKAGRSPFILACPQKAQPASLRRGSAKEVLNPDGSPFLNFAFSAKFRVGIFAGASACSGP